MPLNTATPNHSFAANRARIQGQIANSENVVTPQGNGERAYDPALDAAAKQASAQFYYPQAQNTQPQSIDHLDTQLHIPIGQPSLVEPQPLRQPQAAVTAELVAPQPTLPEAPQQAPPALPESQPVAHLYPESTEQSVHENAGHQVESLQTVQTASSINVAPEMPGENLPQVEAADSTPVLEAEPAAAEVSSNPSDASFAGTIFAKRQSAMHHTRVD